MKVLEATYRVCTAWNLEELDIDLNRVYDWHVKWDKLHVQHNENGSWYEYKPNMYEGHNSDFKRPDYYLLDEAMYDYDVWKCDQDYREDSRYG